MQLEFFDVPSPCVSICQSNDKGFCRGCLRSREERLDWKHYDNDDKQKVIKRCIQRKKREEKKKLEAINEASNANKAEKTNNDLFSSEQSVEETIQPSLLDMPSTKLKKTKEDLDFGDFEL
ncbi:MAG: DUF1289 domain-containing protein [Colwellia sp.]